MRDITSQNEETSVAAIKLAGWLTYRKPLRRTFSGDLPLRAVRPDHMYPSRPNDPSMVYEKALHFSLMTLARIPQVLEFSV